MGSPLTHDLEDWGLSELWARILSTTLTVEIDWIIILAILRYFSVPSPPIIQNELPTALLAIIALIGISWWFVFTLDPWIK